MTHLPVTTFGVHGEIAAFDKIDEKTRGERRLRFRAFFQPSFHE
jgi:hypothetical protein